LKYQYTKEERERERERPRLCFGKHYDRMDVDNSDQTSQPTMLPVLLRDTGKGFIMRLSPVIT